MRRHYEGITKRMASEMESISDQMTHCGEKGRNNEGILAEFLRRHLPTRYTVSTGKVVAVGGLDSKQTDLIIHDRAETPAFVDAHAWSLVPVESVSAVISVKTRLTKDELRESIEGLASVRGLPRLAAVQTSNGQLVSVPETHVLRPRALIFAFESGWATVDGCSTAFVNLLEPTADDLRPNGICLLDQGFVVRRPFTTELVTYATHPLLHFFLFLVKAIDSKGRHQLDLGRYFSEDYGQAGNLTSQMSAVPPPSPSPLAPS